MPCRQTYESIIGTLYLVINSAGAIQGLTFDRPSLKTCGPDPVLKNMLDGYFNGSVRAFDVNIALDEATAFEREVYDALNNVGYGEVRTYKWLAEKLGKPGAARAVGQALKRNPIPIIIPCHRIIESRGAPGGYSLGIAIKRRLLDMEYYNLYEGAPK
jgi:methylated-DNA-[protein]-cysteine S-methyltransferase